MASGQADFLVGMRGTVAVDAAIIRDATTDANRLSVDSSGRIITKVVDNAGSAFGNTNPLYTREATSAFDAPSAVSVGTSATVVIASNTSRKKWFIQNTGATTLYWGINSSVTTANGIRLRPDESIFEEKTTYTGDIYMIGDAASGEARKTEGT